MLDYRALYPLRWARLEILGLNNHPRRLLAPSRLLSRHRSSLSASRIRAIQQSLNFKKSYLEIGVSSGFTFEAVAGTLRVGVDPSPRFDWALLPTGAHFYPMKSREFFEAATSGMTFEFVFLDGLHTATETYLDLVETLQILDEGGVVLIDDVLPPDEASSLPSEDAAREAQQTQLIFHGGWFGDVWRLAYLLLSTKKNFRGVLLGDGKSEHCQLLIQPLKGFAEELVADADFEEMSRLSFSDSVRGGGNALEQLTISALEGLQQIKRW